MFYFLALSIFIFSSYKTSLKHSSLEFLLSFSVGLIFETFNINVNGHYSYANSNSFFFIGLVPISILVAWYTIFMFGKFWSLFLISLVSEKPEVNSSSIPVIILTTSFIASTLVLLIDPIATRLKWWEWYEASPFLEVPIGEIYGIFFATCLIGVVYWLGQHYFFNQIQNFHGRTDIFIIFLYEILTLILLWWSISSSIGNEDVLMGSSVVYLATQVPLILSILIFINSKDYDTYLNNVTINNGNIFKYVFIVGYFMSFLLFLLILFSMNIIIPLNKGMASMHMIFIHFFFVVTLLTVHLNLKLKELN